ncbi:hypothetical protein [Thalassospira xiamenensis]|uniref:DotM C-terminal cytoplasmic domain-containing protein n=1 Tax=Thalassospira xiamenensis TaxID=220697 RepID=A0A285TR08_9PROT|nr:hypothetical protein [Thalassospira xiamenensis]SOC25955.1 hypothetical protein SAMN05428964_10518 [Thalassospira xiamenensis]
MANGSDSGKPTDEITYIVGAAVIAAGCWVLWMQARPVFVYTFFGMDWVQYKLLDLLGLLSPARQQVLQDMEGYLVGIYDPNTVTWEYLTSVDKIVSKTSQYFLAGVIGLFSFVCAFRMKGDNFRREFTLTGESHEKMWRFVGIPVTSKILRFILLCLTTVTFTKGILLKSRKEWRRTGGPSFMHYQAKQWKVLQTGINFDPNVDDPMQNPQMKPVQWLEANNITLSRREGLDEDAVEAAFERQLGEYWGSLETTPVHVQAMCIMAALNLKRHAQNNFVRDQLSVIYGDPKRALEEANKMAAKLIEPYMTDAVITNAINSKAAKHAYITTAVVAIYGWGGPMEEWGGGKAGVLAPSMFRWLKRIDRSLWYALNNVGRRAFHIEGAGIIAHFFAERVSGGKIAEAHVEHAMSGLVDYLKIHNIVDIEEYNRKVVDFIEP